MKTVVLILTLMLMTACGDVASNTTVKPKTKFDITCYSGGEKVLELQNANAQAWSSGWKEYQNDIEKHGTYSDECFLKELK